VRVILTARPRKNPRIPVEAESIIPRHFRQGRDLTVWEGNKERPLREVFDVMVERTAAAAEEVEVILRGDVSRFKRVGEYMDAGKITIEGDIGMHCGNFMTGGTIEIHGNADGWLGREMRGGRILCHGNAGHYAGSGYRGEKFGMKGGTLEILGNAGDFAAEYLAGGEVIIHGNAGDLPGVEMMDGTLFIHGNCSRPCGNMTGGTCTVLGKVRGMLPTFRKNSILLHGSEKIPLTVFEGDIANRGKGILQVREYTYDE
jgi:formylmethanofuran dehydrogenase subunit C